MSEERFCRVCGGKLRTRQRMYCSCACRDAAEREKIRQRRERKKELRICKFCGKEFLPGKYTKKYCSEECQKANYSVREPLEERECVVCHRMYIPRAINQEYCSKQCRQRSWTMVGMYDDKPKPRPVKNRSELSRAVADLVIYNETHKTNLTYGEAVARGII